MGISFTFDLSTIDFFFFEKAIISQMVLGKMGRRITKNEMENGEWRILPWLDSGGTYS